VVLQVDEAGGLEAVQDGGGGCVALAGGAGLEEGEIYELGQGLGLFGGWMEGVGGAYGDEEVVAVDCAGLGGHLAWGRILALNSRYLRRDI
jgi:hypothetical protein